MELPVNPSDSAQSSNPEFSFSAESTPFDAIGGIERVRELVERFYRHMGRDPEFASTRSLYPQDLSGSREKLFEFLVGWLGGPPLYVERRGHPRLRMRHLPFSIGDRERDHWLTCMGRAMDEMEIDGELRRFLDQRFRHVANFLRNRPETA